MEITQINRLLGNMDLYLLDQVLKDRFHKNMKILDAGCGEGRNLIYFLNQGYDVYGVDKNPDAIRILQFVARSINPKIDKKKFITTDLVEIPFPDNKFEMIISSAVLHFAQSLDQFRVMFAELVRVLRKEGILFIRTAAQEGIEDEVKLISDRQFYLPDGSTRLLINREILQKLMDIHHLSFIEPAKFVVVDGQRSMTALVMRKN